MIPWRLLSRCFDLSRWTATLIRLGVLLGVIDGGPLVLGADAPLVLERQTVSADIPVHKVAEYKMSEPRFAPAAAVVGDFIYIIGGSSSGGLSDTIERFDIRTHQSKIVGHLHVARLWHAAITVGDWIYVIGGMSAQTMNPVGLPANEVSTGQSLDNSDRLRALQRQETFSDPAASAMSLALESSVEVFHPDSGKVTAGRTMPQARAQFGCVVWNSEIYVIGGRSVYGDRPAHSNRVEIYNVASGQWREGVPMPAPMTTASVVVDGGFLVVAGGYDSTRTHAEVYIFNPRTDGWSSIPPLCQESSAHSLVFFRHYLLLFGSYDHPDELLAYDLKTKNSEVFTLQYTPARHTAAVVHSNRIYVCGGKPFKAANALDIVQVFAGKE